MPYPTLCYRAVPHFYHALGHSICSYLNINLMQWSSKKKTNKKNPVTTDSGRSPVFPIMSRLGQECSRQVHSHNEEKLACVCMHTNTPLVAMAQPNLFGLSI